MRHVLHILTKKNDALAKTISEQQENLARQTIETVDLTQPKPDYDELVRKIFDADSIEVW
jgi:hypothetical protein